MKVPKLELTAGTIIFGAVGLASFLNLWHQARYFDFWQHRLDFSILSFSLFFLIALVIIVIFYLSSSVIFAKIHQISWAEALEVSLPSLWPFALFHLAPLTLRHFLTRSDLYSRLCLMSGIILAGVFVGLVIISGQKRKKLGKEGRLQPWFSSRSRKQKILILFSLAFFLYGLGAFIIQQRGITFSGDEPHYLIVAHSLIFDHDFDLSNNYDQKDYQYFLGSGVIIQPHTVPGAQANSRLSFHSPGVSFLVLPFYWLGFRLGGWAFPLILRLAMALWGSLLSLQLFLIAKDKGWSDSIALRLWVIFSFTVPVYFYSIHLYPEIIAALISLSIFRWFGRGQRLTARQLFLAGLLLSLLLWFHSLKYLFIILPLLLYAVVKILGKKSWPQDLFLFLGPFVTGSGAYFWFQKTLYGSLNPTAVSWQGTMDLRQSLSFLQNILFNIPFRFRLETLVGYFLDQRDGLLLYAPVYLLAFVGLILMLRERSRFAWLLLFLTWPYFLNSAFLTQRAGYAPQARPLVASFWGLALFLGYFLLRNEKKYLKALTTIAVFYSLFATALLIFYPLNLYQETTAGTTERAGGFFYLLSHLHFSWPSILPSFLKIENNFWLPNYIWIALFLAFLVLSQGRFDLRIRLSSKKSLILVGGCLFGLLFWFGYFPRLVLTHPAPRRWPENQSVTFYSLSRVAKLKEPGTFSLPQDNRAYHFWFTTREKLTAINIELEWPAGKVPCQLSYFDHVFFKGEIRANKTRPLLASFPVYRLGKNYLYWLRIELGGAEEGNISQTPLLFSFRLKSR